MAETNQRLRLLVERIENLIEERKNLSDDIKDVYLEAKSSGFDPKVLRKVIKLRAMKPDDRAEMEALLDTYLSNLGMQMDLPLATAA